MKPDRMTAATITQHELREYQALRGQLEALKRLVAEERERLLRLVEADAPVEPGRFEVTVDEPSSRGSRRRSLVALIGADRSCPFWSLAIAVGCS